MPEDPYVYPGTNTLRNRYDLRDAAELSRLEADLSTRRLAELAEHPLPGEYDLPHLQAFHERIFGDVYPWAGEIRTVAIAKGDLFALPQHIEPYLTEILSRLPAEQHLQGLAIGPLVDRLAHYLAEINSTHPFREGNGRAQRAFIGQLALQAGHRIAWQHLDPARNIHASRAAHRGDNAPIRALLADLIDAPPPNDIARLRAAAFPQPAAFPAGRRPPGNPQPRTPPPRRPPRRRPGR